MLANSTSGQGGLPAFIHVPKTAGTTLYAIIRHVYLPGELHKLHATSASIRRYKALPRRRRNALQMVYGHVDFSVSEILPSHTRFFTVLRDPVERAISHYYHFRRVTTNPMHEQAMTSSLLQWVSTDGIAEMDNGQTRRLAGEMDLPYGEVSSQTLERAKANLAASFAVTGLTERFEESHILLCRAFGWPLYRYRAHNVGTDRPRRAEVAESVLKVIENCNRFDLELYQHASKLFEQAIGNIDIAHELSRLRAAPEYVAPNPSTSAYRRAASRFLSFFSAKNLQN
jgi:hypothetical protein